MIDCEVPGIGCRVCGTGFRSYKITGRGSFRTNVLTDAVGFAGDSHAELRSRGFYGVRFMPPVITNR